MDSPRLFTVISQHICFSTFSFSVLHFLVVGSVQHVSFRAHVKIASRIVSYRIVAYVLCRYAMCRDRLVGPVN